MKNNEFGLEEFAGSHGKKPNQKLKPYLVQQYLLKNTDEDHLVDAADIIAFLEYCGITAERRSIYRDIEDINKVMWLMENKADDEDGIDISAAEKAITADKYDSEKIIVYDRSKKGFMCGSVTMTAVTSDFWQSASIPQNFSRRDRPTALRIWPASLSVSIRQRRSGTMVF